MVKNYFKVDYEFFGEHQFADRRIGISKIIFTPRIAGPYLYAKVKTPTVGIWLRPWIVYRVIKGDRWNEHSKRGLSK